jgi:hypothetical protein
LKRRERRAPVTRIARQSFSPCGKVSAGSPAPSIPG